MGERSFFVDPESIRGERVDLRGQVAHQIRTVLRLRPGDEIELLDNSGHLYVARITGLSHEVVTAEVVERRLPATEPRVDLELYQALLKGEKMELVLQKGTEIGVRRFVPLISERCVSRPSRSDLERRRTRWEAIVREAAEQSGRTVLPDVAALQLLDEACRTAAEAHLAVMAWEEERSAGMRQLLRESGLSVLNGGSRVARSRVAVLVGPEGGFSRREAEIARAAGIRMARLGPRILRAETAALVAATIVLCEMGDLDG